MEENKYKEEWEFLNDNQQQNKFSYKNAPEDDNSEHYSKLTNEIPNSLTSNKSYKDFYKICKAYYHELKDYNSKNRTLVKSDIIVLNDLVKEINTYTLELIKTGSHIEEAKSIIKIGLKITDYLLKILHSYIKSEEVRNNNSSLRSDNTSSNYRKNNTTNNKLSDYPLSLKLMLLETKFHISFNIELNYNDAEKIIEEVMRIQNIIKASRFNLGCSVFYLGIIKFSKL